LMSFTETFVTTISQTWNLGESPSTGAPVASGAPKPEQPAPPTPAPTAAAAAPTPGAPARGFSDRARRAALEIKIANVTGALQIATSPNPTVGVADMVTLVTLQRMILQDPWAAETFGPDKARSIVNAYKEQE